VVQVVAVTDARNAMAPLSLTVTSGAPAHWSPRARTLIDFDPVVVTDPKAVPLLHTSMARPASAVASS
jgi:hypothetical protein